MGLRIRMTPKPEARKRTADGQRAWGWRGRRFLVCAAVVVGMAVGGAVANGAIPTSNTGAINGCYEKRTGLLRVVDAEAAKTCLSFEIPISWNERGQQGVQGIEGPSGPKGDRGDTGATGPQGDRGPQGEQGPQGQQGTVASQSCPAGQAVTGFTSAGTIVCSTFSAPPAIPVGGSTDYDNDGVPAIWENGMQVAGDCDDWNPADLRNSYPNCY
jgi:hypothetical protein